MSVTQTQFIEQARKYLGVKYLNQGRTLSGTDCGGLLLMVGRELGLTDLEFLSYANSPDGETFERLLKDNCERVTPFRKPSLGDILACDFGEGIQHTAIVSVLEPRLTVIHARRDHGVVEQYLHGRYERGWVKTYRLSGVIDG